MQTFNLLIQYMQYLCHNQYVKDEILNVDNVSFLIALKPKPKGEPPKITQKLSPKNANDGDKVEFVAKMTGTEPLDVQWAFNKKPIKSDDVYNISYAKGTATLKLEEVFPEDSGEYSVVAKNQFGSVTSMASLKVKGNLAIWLLCLAS